CQHGYGIPITF
nr:immunoglobulin light chain junction region [Macaca mulatta]MPN92218.1 immunoglobulin light chain junction region [Macaca mulatta]